MTEFHFQSDGADLFAVETGSGDPVVLLHGGLADHSVSLALFGTLATDFRLLAPDLRGSGQSRYAGELSWPQLSRDLSALLDARGIRRAIVVGMSSGSGVAVHFARTQAERVKGLAIVTPVYGGEAFGLTNGQAASFSSMDALGRRAREEGIQAIYPLYDRLPSGVRERALALASTFDPASVAATTRFLAAGSQPFAEASDLHALTVPAFLVPGSDFLHPAEVSAIYRAQIRNCTEATGADVPRQLRDFCMKIQGG